MGTKIALMEDGPGSYRFAFSSKRGEVSGRVTVGVEGPPDKRSDEDRETGGQESDLGAIERVLGSVRTMIGRSLSKTVLFNTPFLLPAIARVLPAKAYRVVTGEELLEEISFPVYRRDRDAAQ
jgi:hypothetical protein